MRHFYGKPHEGEAGLAIAGFVKETFKSIGVVRRVSKLSSTPLGKTYISYALLDIVKTVDKSKVKDVFDDIKKIKDLNGLEFFKGIKGIVESRFDSEVRRRIDRMYALRISNAIVGEKAIYDPISERLISIDPVSGKPVIAKGGLKGEVLEELMYHGLKDKAKDIFVNYAEWKMLKIIDEGMSKGFSGKELGLYVFKRLRDELRKDEYFYESFHYYLAKHLDKLRVSESASVAFAEVLVQINKMYRRLLASMGRVIASVPVFGAVAEPLVSMYESFGELGESIGEAIKKSKKERSIRTIKVDPNRKDALFEFI